MASLLVAAGGSTEAIGIIAVNVAVTAAMVSILAVVFKRQFISERRELKTIRSSEEQLAQLVMILSEAYSELTALAIFQQGLIRRVIDTTTICESLPGLDEQLGLLTADVERAQFELDLLLGDEQRVVSAARHLSQGAARVESRDLIGQVAGRFTGDARRALLVARERLDQRFNSSSR